MVWVDGGLGFVCGDYVGCFGLDWLDGLSLMGLGVDLGLWVCV